jgi:predicted acyl esterase
MSDLAAARGGRTRNASANWRAAAFVGCASSSWRQNTHTATCQEVHVLRDGGRLEGQVLVPARAAAPPVLLELEDQLVVRGAHVVLDADARRAR